MMSMQYSYRFESDLLNPPATAGGTDPSSQLFVTFDGKAHRLVLIGGICVICGLP